MSFIVSPYLPFPPVIWWASANRAGAVLLDGEEHFVKATARNRYRIATANGPLQLSIPLQGGRGQRTAMKEVLIDNSLRWEQQHWKGILAAYGHAPYFEHYAPGLEALFLKKQHTLLAHFCLESIEWLCAAARAPLAFEATADFRKEYSGAACDWRFTNSKKLSEALLLPRYPQVFEDHHGFLPNLSLLDVVMNEGPVAGLYTAQLKTA